MTRIRKFFSKWFLNFHEYWMSCVNTRTIYIQPVHSQLDKWGPLSNNTWILTNLNISGKYIKISSIFLISPFHSTHFNHHAPREECAFGLRRKIQKLNFILSQQSHVHFSLFCQCTVIENGVSIREKTVLKSQRDFQQLTKTGSLKGKT